MRTALLVIDMIQDYVLPQASLYCAAAATIIAPINQAISHADMHNLPVIFCNTELTAPDQPVARLWGLHAIKGSAGAKLHEAIQQPAQSTIIAKTGYNAFHATGLHQQLQQAGVTSVALCGIHTHVCVGLTAIAAFEHGYEVTVLSDATTTDNPDKHRAYLNFLASHAGAISSVAEWMAQS